MSNQNQLLPSSDVSPTASASASVRETELLLDGWSWGKAAPTSVPEDLG